MTPYLESLITHFEFAVEVNRAIPFIDFKGNASDKSRSSVWNKAVQFYNLNRDVFYPLP